MNILNWFKKKEINVDIKSFEEKCPVGSWYKSGSNQIIRLSNIYIKNNNLFITIEYPFFNQTKNRFIIEKEDDKSPAFLNGRFKVSAKESEKLETSYWKVIEQDLYNKTQVSKKHYEKFLAVGEK